jgi:SAM-dependent methyltransferase
MSTAVDSWKVGTAYERYMGRWSRLLGPVFLDWLRPAPEAHWLEIGCGTGALTRSIALHARPLSVVGCDPSSSFVEEARRKVSDSRVSFSLAAANELPSRADGFDFVVSGLVLNFVPKIEKALVTMRERARAGGTVAAYVWSYRDVGFLHRFWEAATTLDPSATSLDESRRFERWSTTTLEALFHGARLTNVETTKLEITTEFASFDDYWQPFLGATGPAPSYVAALEPTRRSLLEASLRARLPFDQSGRLVLRASANAVRGRAA